MTQRMPAVFVGHGSPMNAIEENEFSRGWKKAAEGWPRPRAVVCVSAHWETRGTYLTAAKRPETIHDFYGFPEPLYEVSYPAPGDPALAERAAGLLQHARARLDAGRGLDHGCWSVLKAMYPRSDVPVVQLSMDTAEAADWHFDLAASLAPLRDEGVLLIGSGNMVHNLSVMEYRSGRGFGWAERINGAMRRAIEAGRDRALVDYPSLDKEALLAVPTPEHYLPLLYVLALRKAGEPLSFFNDKCVMGSISMTSVRVG